MTGGGQSCHPTTAAFKGQIYMACTPYPYGEECYENPCVYVKDTAAGKWDPILNAFPIVFPDKLGFEHYSDPCLFTDGNTLVLLFRKCERREQGKIDQLYEAHSSEGMTWSGPKMIAEGRGDSLISPAVIPDMGYMFCVRSGQKAGYTATEIMRYRLDDTIAVDEGELCTVRGLEEEYFVWHIDIAKDQDGDIQGLFMLQKRCQGIVSKLALFRYDEKDNAWSWDRDIQLDDEEHKWVDFIYKSTFIYNGERLLCSARDHKRRFFLFEKEL